MNYDILLNSLLSFLCPFFISKASVSPQQKWEMSQRFVSLNGLRPVLIPADYPDASLKWCYLHLKEQDWESSSFLAQLCSDLLCESLSWQTGQIHTHRAVINNLNLAAKKKWEGASLKGDFMSDCISVMAVLGGSGVYLHPPFQPPSSHYCASVRSWEWATQTTPARNDSTHHQYPGSS